MFSLRAALLFETLFCCLILDSFGIGNTDVNVLVLVPFPDSDNPPAYSDGLSLIPSVLIALDHINEQKDMLLNHTLKVIIGDSACEQTPKTVLSYVPHLTSKNQKPLAVIGPTCSESSVYIASLSQRERFDTVQAFLGTTPTLNDHNKLSNSFGLIESTQIYAKLLVRLAECNNWTKVSIIYEPRNYFLDTLAVIREALADQNVNISYEGIVIQPLLALPLIKADHQIQGTRIIIVLVSGILAGPLACLANGLNFTFPNYQFIFINRKKSDFIMETDFKIDLGDSKMYDCTTTNIVNGLNMAVLLRYSLLASEDLKTISQRTVGEISIEYKKKICSQESSFITNASFSYNYHSEVQKYCSENSGIAIEESIFAYPYYDATWAIAMGLNNTLSYLSSSSSSIAPILSPTSDITNLLRNEMENVSFQGVSTYVDFDEKTGHVKNDAHIFQVQSGEVKEIKCNNSKSFIRDSFFTQYETLNDYLSAVGVIFITVSIVLTLVLHILHTVYRKHPQIKASSPILNQFIFGGCYVIVCSAILTTMQSTILQSRSLTSNVIACNFSHYLSNLGYDIIFGTLCAKLWRIYNIFKRTFEKQRLMYNRTLVVGIIVIITTNAAFHLWMVKYNIQAKRVLGGVIQSKEEYIQIENIQCQFDDIGYTLIPYVFHIVLTVAALVLSILTRDIKYREFRSSRSTIILAYVLAFTWIVIEALIFIYTNKSVIVYLLNLAGSISTVFLCHALLILPIIFPALRAAVIHYKKNHHVQMS